MISSTPLALNTISVLMTSTFVSPSPSFSWDPDMPAIYLASPLGCPLETSKLTRPAKHSVAMFTAAQQGTLLECRLPSPPIVAPSTSFEAWGSYHTSLSLIVFILINQGCQQCLPHGTIVKMSTFLLVKDTEQAGAWLVLSYVGCCCLSPLCVPHIHFWSISNFFCL